MMEHRSGIPSEMKQHRKTVFLEIIPKFRPQVRRSSPVDQVLVIQIQDVPRQTGR